MRREENSQKNRNFDFSKKLAPDSFFCFSFTRSKNMKKIERGPKKWTGCCRRRLQLMWKGRHAILARNGNGFPGWKKRTYPNVAVDVTVSCLIIFPQNLRTFWKKWEFCTFLAQNDKNTNFQNISSQEDKVAGLGKIHTEGKNWSQINMITRMKKTQKTKNEKSDKKWHRRLDYEKSQK